MEEKFDEEIELDREKVKEIVPQKFHKWLKVFGKVKSERIPIRKPCIRLANSKAGIKPTALLSAFDKENSIEFPLDSVHYLYKQSNPNPVFLSCASL